MTSTDHLSPAPSDSRYRSLLFILVALIAIVIQLRPLDDRDLFTQIQLGQWTLAHGHFPASDPFLLNVSTPPALGWLAQIVFALIYQLDAFRGVHIFHAILFATAFGCTAQIALRDSARRLPSISSVAIGTLLSFLITASNTSARPQVFAILCFSLTYLITKSSLSRLKKILSLIPIALVWQNTHPSIAIGIILVATVIGAKLLQRKPIQDELIIGGVLFVAQLATPDFLTLFALAHKNYLISHDLLRISEWMPPFNASVIDAMIPFWVVFAVQLLLLIRLRFRVEREELLIFLVFAALSLSSARFSLFFSLATLPGTIHWLDQALLHRFIPGKTSSGAVQSKYPSVLQLPICLAAAAIIPTTMISSRVDPKLPIALLNDLKRQIPHGTIYTYRELAGVTTFVGGEAWKLPIDGRLYLFPPEEISHYYMIARGEVPLEIIEAQYTPAAFVLNADFDQALIQLLSHSRRWRTFAHFQDTHIFVPTPAP